MFPEIIPTAHPRSTLTAMEQGACLLHHQPVNQRQCGCSLAPTADAAAG